MSRLDSPAKNDLRDWIQIAGRASHEAPLVDCCRLVCPARNGHGICPTESKPNYIGAAVRLLPYVGRAVGMARWLHIRPDHDAVGHCRYCRPDSAAASRL